jgi:hypothetical protein
VDTSGSELYSANRGKQSGRADLSYHLSRDLLLLVIVFLRPFFLYPRRFLSNFIDKGKIALQLFMSAASLCAQRLDICP